MLDLSIRNPQKCLATLRLSVYMGNRVRSYPNMISSITYGDYLQEGNRVTPPHF